MAALGAWSLVPLAILFRRAERTGTILTGADGPIAGDQLQYLTWIRQAGEHVLIANQWDLAPSHHVFLHPLFLLSGLAWQLGVSLPVSYLAWKPVAVVVLFAGVLAYCRRLLPGSPGTRLAAVVLAVFYNVPLTRLLTLTHLGSTGDASGVLFPAGQLWGYLPSAIALGLMPVFLLAAERALASGRGPLARGVRGPLTGAAIAGALVAWLHPWQGETLVLIAAGWIAWDRSWRQARVLAAPVLATLAPLAYYFALSRLDAAWKIGADVPVLGRFPLWVLVLGLLPLAVLAPLGLRLHKGNLQERALALWPVATLAVYFVTPSVPAHSLQGLSIPLAVLAVRGWGRVPAPAWLGAAAVALLTLPGSVNAADQFRKIADADLQPLLITKSERQALSYVARSAPAGGVLAAPFIALDVPPATGRSVWVGHISWTPDFERRVRETFDLFSGRLNRVQASGLVLSTGATLLISDCRSRADLQPALRSLLARVRRFGCATVYELRPRNGVAQLRTAK